MKPSSETRKDFSDDERHPNTWETSGEPMDEGYEVYDDSDLPDDDDDLDDCGMTPGGQCMLAGSEWCDWSCPRGRMKR